MKRLPFFILLALFVIQLPLSYLALSLVYGVARQGPGYLSTVETVLRGAPPDRPPIASDRPADAQNTGIVIERQPEGAGLPRPLVSASGGRPPVRSAADLPGFGFESRLSMLIAQTADVRIDYVSVPPREAKPALVTLRFRPARGPRLLVLAGRPGLSWEFPADLPPGLIGVVVLSAAAPDAGRVFGLPEGVPIEQLAGSRERFPFVTSVLPDCQAAATSAPRFACSGLVAEAGGRFRTSFDTADEGVRQITGAPIATLSASYADLESNPVLIPQEVVTTGLKQRAAKHLERHLAAVELEKQRARTIQSYVERFARDRRDRALAMMQKHPLPEPETIALRRPEVLVVSAYETPASRERPARGIQDVATYEDYEALAQAGIGSIRVRLDLQSPTVVIASAYAPIDWQFDVTGGEHLLAIQVEGIGMPAVVSAPPEVPIVVRNRLLGDRDALGYVRPQTKSQGADSSETREIARMLARAERFGSGEPVLFSEYRASRFDISPRAAPGSETNRKDLPAKVAP